MVCKVSGLFRGLALAATALCLLSPPSASLALAGDVRQNNIDAVHALAQDSARFQLSQLYFECEDKELLFIGTRHTHDPNDPQIEGIAALFAAFEPTLVLIEGGDWPIAATKRDAVLQYGELGFTRFLAANENIRAVSADAPMGEVIAAGLRQHSPVETKLYFALRMVPQWMQQKTGKPIEQSMREWLSSTELNRHFSANTPPNDIGELRRELATRVPTLRDWRSVQFDLSFDGGKRSLLNQVDLSVNTFRNAHFKRQILAGLRKGERVLMVAGHTHLGQIAPLFQRGMPDD